MTNLEKTEILKNMSEQLKNEFEAFKIMANEVGIDKESIKDFYKETWNSYVRSRKRIMES